MSDLTLNIALDYFRKENSISINVHAICGGKTRELIKQHKVTSKEIPDENMFGYLEDIIGKEIIKYPEYNIADS